ncbi:MAG: hypothetical protein ACREK8_10240 [Gemmatimonadales bacterium]
MTAPTPVLFGLARWKTTVVLLPCAFCAWVIYLTVTLAGSRHQVQNGLVVATHFSVMDDRLRREDNAGDSAAASPVVNESWPLIRAQFDSAQQILRSDAPLTQITEPNIDQLRVAATDLDKLTRELANKGLAGPARADSLARVRVLNAHVADLLADTREQLRARLATLVVDVGHSWAKLAIIAVVSMILAFTTTLLLLAYGHVHVGGKRLALDNRQLRAKVKQLEGILPVCSHCKRVRDDAASRRPIEAYVGQHPNTTFHAGMCLSCYEAYGVPEPKPTIRERSARH